MKPWAAATWLNLAAKKKTLNVSEKFVELHFELGHRLLPFYKLFPVHCCTASAQIPWIYRAESQRRFTQFAPRNNNQREPSHFTRLTSSPEEDVTRQQRRRVVPPRDLLGVWATPRRRGWGWSRCGPERGRRRARCKSSPPASCCPSGCSRCPGSVCRYLVSTSSRISQTSTRLQESALLGVCYFQILISRLSFS